MSEHGKRSVYIANGDNPVVKIVGNMQGTRRIVQIHVGNLTGDVVHIEEAVWERIAARVADLLSAGPLTGKIVSIKNTNPNTSLTVYFMDGGRYELDPGERLLGIRIGAYDEKEQTYTAHVGKLSQRAFGMTKELAERLVREAEGKETLPAAHVGREPAKEITGQGRTREQLTVEHGTPNQFRAACIKAADQGFCALEEAEKGSDAYEKEWREAPE